MQQVAVAVAAAATAAWELPFAISFGAGKCHKATPTTATTAPTIGNQAPTT